MEKYLYGAILWPLTSMNFHRKCHMKNIDTEPFYRR